jgi:acyl-CoA thioester hydrolase
MSDEFVHEVRTRWFDTDALGHVNNAVFLTYLEEARDTWFAERLGSREVYVLVRIEVDFVRELGRDTKRVLVHVSAERLGRKSVTMSETLRDEAGEVVAQAKTTAVRWDPGRQAAVEFTDVEREALMPTRTAS